MALVGMAQRLPDKGVPLLDNFTPAQYHHKGKVWDIKSAPNGIVYMAADGGLLEYDGKNWRSFRGSKGFTRSVWVANDSLVYTGSDLDFGVWKRNAYQVFEYNSLYPFQEDASDISEEFWDVYSLLGKIIFVSSQNLYLTGGDNQLTRIPAPDKFTGSFPGRDAVYLADETQGLFRFNGWTLKKVFSYPSGKTLQISGIYEDDKHLRIVTRNEGLYIFSSGVLKSVDNTLSRELQSANVFCFESIGEAYWAFGTVLKGLYITDLNGNILHHINKYKGLPHNTVLSLHYSPVGKLWMGMEYGVSSLDLQHPLTYFFDYRGDFGTGYTALLKDGVFYLGANQGLYRTQWSALDNTSDFHRFELVPNSEGQVWALANVKGAVLVGHDRGLFVLGKDGLRQLSPQKGVWTILPYKQYLLTGHYNGISVFHNVGGQWALLKKMELILGSCNQLIAENEHTLWVNIPNYGIIRAVLNNELYPTDRQIFPVSDFEGENLCLLKDEDGVLVQTNRFQYRFIPADKKFAPAEAPMPQPRVKALLPGVYQPIALHPDYEFYPVFNGFALRYRHKLSAQASPSYVLMARSIEAFNNEEQAQFYPGAVIPYRLNNLRVEFSVPNQDDVCFQYKTAESAEWKHWTPTNKFEFFGLKPGDFTIQARAKVKDTLTTEITLPFRIAAPWYLSWYAYLAYGTAFALLVLLLRHRHTRALKKQRQQLLLQEQNALREQAEQHAQELLRLEQEKQRLELEQLRQQLKSKTIELAGKAKDNEAKNRLLLTLKEKLESIQKNTSALPMRWREIQALLDAHISAEDKTFEIQMDELHQEFYKKLKEKFPGLSLNDLRLCAYLKIGLNTKEIADLLNVLPSSAFITRSRLRKKLELKPEEDLYDYLNRI